jgi:phage terminase large subunit
MPKTIEAVVQDHGYKVEVIPVRSLKDQINETRLLFARAKFDDKKCAAGLEALRHYRWGFNTTMGEFKPEPVHDWASHASSALMGAAMAMRVNSAKPKPQRIQTRGIV